MISTQEMEAILAEARKTGADFAELYLEDRNDTILKCLNKTINGVTSLHIHGAGIYVLSGIHSVYVYTNDTSLHSLKNLAKKAAALIERKIKNPGVCMESRRLSFQRYPSPVRTEIAPNTVAVSRKQDIVREMDLAARSAGPAVRSLNTEYYDEIQHITIANSEGLLTEDTRVFTRVRLAGCVEWQDQSTFAFQDYVKPAGFEIFQEKEDYIGFAQDSIRAMEARLKAADVKPCVVPVVFEGGTSGVFWHEACGHNLETTGIAEGIGDFGDKMGKQVASEKVTLIDDGTVPGLCGSEAIDDEGCPTRKNVLIENGVIKNFLCDRLGARRFGLSQNGSGRRQSYSFAPAARMHNTYLAAGEDDEEEMIRSLPEGLYVTGLGGGNSGSEFAIAVTDGFWIKNGQISHQVKGVTLSGNASDIIKRVDRVGKKVIPDLGGGFCGASSGLVQTTAYQPRMRVSAMNVAGTAKE
ncbi:MAG: TldD/PmbA family protein [Eubacteriales bacterium]|nr:TldD/PmbA family protein [Eubacteriales bacterium]